jgi:ribonuclease III
LGAVTPRSGLAAAGQPSLQLGHDFKNPVLVLSALTHGSRHDASDTYQRLEFLGDRVLSLVIAEALFHQFPDEHEGPLAARLSLLVRAETCAQVGQVLKLEDHIILGAVERRKGVQRMASVLGDVVEALIGALYLDGGMEVAKAFILRNWQGLLARDVSELKDAKTFVQEWALARAFPLPHYEVQNREGPQHAPVFTISLQVGALAPSIGVGSSKQLAEMDAARAFINREGLR